MIVCKVCGATNEQGATFCGTCGAFLEWSGEAVQPDGSTQPQGRRATARRPPRPGPRGAPGGDASRRHHGRSVTPVAADRGPGAAGLDHLFELRHGQRPDPRLLLALRDGARGRRRARDRQSPPRRPTAARIPPVAIAGAIGGVAVLAVLAFVFLLPKSPAPRPRPRHRGPVRRRRRGPPSTAASASAAVRSGAVASPSPSSEPRPPAPPVPTGRIAFRRARTATPTSMVWSADTGEIDKLVGGKGDQTDPAWSPGRRTASSTVDSTGPSAPTAARPTRGCASSRPTAATAERVRLHPPRRRPQPGLVARRQARSSSRRRATTRRTRTSTSTRAVSRRRPGENLLVDNPADDWDPA